MRASGSTVQASADRSVVAFKRRVVASAALSAAGLVIAVFLVLRGERRLAEALRLVADTRAVLEQIEQVLRLMVDAQSASRGFIITGQDSFLAPYAAARGEAEAQVAWVAARVAGDVAQRRRIETLRRLVSHHLDERDWLILTARRDGFAAARRIVASSAGEATMNSIRGVSGELRAAEERVLRERQAVAASAERTSNLALGLVILVVLLGAAAAYTHLQQRDAERAQLKEQAFRLGEATRVQRQIEDILNAVDLGVFGLDAEGITRFANPSTERLLGYRGEEMLGGVQHELIHHSKRDGSPYPREECLIYAVLQDGVTRRVADEVFWRKDGSSIPVEYSSTAIRDGEDRVTGAVVVFDDITERKRAEDALRRSEERFAMAFRNSPDAIVIARLRDGCIIETNDAWLSIFGTTRAEVIGRRSVDLEIFVDPQDRQRGIDRLQRDGSVRNVPLDIRRPSGEVRHTLLSCEISQIEDETCTLTFVRDVTDLQRARDELARLNADLERRVEERTMALEHANREMESFSYSVSHDLRAPLRHIHGYAGMLRSATDGQLSSEGRRYLDVIEDASQQMGRLIDDLLSFSRMSRKEMDRGSVDLNALVQECLSGLESAMRGRRIDWTIAALPRVRGDHGLLKQVFVNLLDNAIKYTRPRDPAQIEVGHASNENGRVVVFVRDNGVGFDPRYASKLFGVFQRLHRAEEFEGTGVGLANVQRVITRHGGRAWAEGQPDKGTAVYVTLERDELPNKGEEAG